MYGCVWPQPRSSQLTLAQRSAETVQNCTCSRWWGPGMHGLCFPWPSPCSWQVGCSAPGGSVCWPSSLIFEVRRNRLSPPQFNYSLISPPRSSWLVISRQGKRRRRNVLVCVSRRNSIHSSLWRIESVIVVDCVRLYIAACSRLPAHSQCEVRISSHHAVCGLSHTKQDLVVSIAGAGWLAFTLLFCGPCGVPCTL